jgi:hypothetical protein
MDMIKNCSGWMLDRIARLDAHHPGVAGHFLRASAERRQVISAYCAAHEFNESTAADTARFLATAGHRAILARAFATVPSGLRGALRRAGVQQQPADLYPLLYKLLANPPHPAVAQTIGQLSEITTDMLKVVQALPEALCTANMVVAARDVKTACTLGKLIPLMVRAGADRDGLVGAVRRVTDRPDLEKVLHRWSLKLTFPSGPIAQSSCYTPIANGMMLKKVGLKYRNCIRTYPADILDRATSFGEFRHNESEVLIEMHRENGIWMFHSAHGYRNRSLNREVREAAEAFCRRHGVLGRYAAPANDTGWSMLRDIAHFRRFRF